MSQKNNHPFSLLIMLILGLTALTHGDDRYVFSTIETPSASQAHGASDMQDLLSDLQTAYFAETTASEEYSAFAEKAEEEGYHAAASLFRALSIAEQIHATKRAILIHQLGEIPEKPSEPIIVESTAQNLDCAIEAETYEKGFMYPDFISNAGNTAMHASFETMVVSFYQYCLKAETVHLNLLQNARKDLNISEENLATFLVCPRCGCIQSTKDFEFCTMCAIHQEEFITVR